MSFKTIQNTESIKILKKINFLGVMIFFVAFFGGLISYFITSESGVLSFEVGFFSFLLIFFCLFFSMNKRLGNESEIEDKLSHKISLGFGISFSFGRIFSYFIIFAMLVLLLHFELFMLYTYMIGIFCSLFLSLLYIKRKYIK